MEFPVKPRLATNDGPDEIMKRLGFTVEGQTAISPAVDSLKLHQPITAGRVTVLENYKMAIAGVPVAHASMILQNGEVSVVTRLNKSPAPELHQISLGALTNGIDLLSHQLTTPEMPAQKPRYFSEGLGKTPQAFIPHLHFGPN